MKYGILLNGRLIYAQPYYFCSDGRKIVNFNKSVELMTAYGFKPVFDNIPDYDEKTQCIVFSHYEETEENILIEYEVLDIVLTTAQLKQQDKEKCLKMFAETLSDEQALEVPLIFDEFEVGKGYEVGKRILYQGVLYKVITSHTSQETWTPDVSPSLFAPIINETIDGGIPEWKQPDSTNAYMIGDRVMFENKEYESLVDNNVWSPSANPSGWQLVEEEIEEPETPVEPEIPVEPEPEPEPELPEEPTEPIEPTIPEWVQPDATTAYKKGDRVMFEGKVYESVIDGNVWSPTAYPAGWQLIEE
jgi:hypothetical protein